MSNLCWPQRTAMALGVVLVVWGVVDLFGGRPALGLLHLITGGLVLGTAFRVRAERFADTLTGLVFLVVFALGVSDPGGVFDAGTIGNVVHLLLGFAAVALAESCVWCEQRAKTARDGRGAERMP